MQRVVSAVRFLSSRGLTFRGDTEVLNSRQNDNYLGILELLAEYDPFLSSHIAKYGNQGRGKASYQSSTTCEEVIEIMGNKVLKTIVEEIKEPKYFSLSADSTPDISHTDQLTVVICYVGKSDHKIVERFIAFIPIASHTGEALANIVLKFFEQIGIDVASLRGQSYDNASNMSGCYKGLQAHILSINHLAHYIPCTAHSLNLVGVCAVESCIGAVSFFGLIQKLYNFFSGSTQRWSVIPQCLKAESGSESTLVVKRASDAILSTRADATKALSKRYSYFQEALKLISEDVNQKVDTRYEANTILKQLSKLETVLLADFWAVILERFNQVSKLLQHETLELQ
ncbi:zinc finger MYM-type protein 1-like [Limulus polyphemus]|uniref:Zinc finger MYM-type protein 1-like n=1 Tax=Limulus polyphemus TaxID=6850 RepID=A0ABM1B7Y6_LIMPO|nr:zinc finger MYM-type protein 1-like [Limulus polyphemus]